MIRTTAYQERLDALSTGAEGERLAAEYLLNVHLVFVAVNDGTVFDQYGAEGFVAVLCGGFGQAQSLLHEENILGRLRHKMPSFVDLN